jgi:sodium/potassium-transporting ATPase subunit alpha
MNVNSIATGLTREFAQERLQKLGQNIVKPAKQLPLWAKFLLCFVTGFAPLLWTASGLSFISWEPFGTPPTNLYNLILAVVLIIVIVISGSFVFYQVT